MSEGAVSVVRSVYASQSAAAAWPELVHTEFEVHDPTRPDPIDPGGVWRGRDGARRYIQEWVEGWAEFDAVAEEIHDTGERVVVRVRASGRARMSGVTFGDVRYHVWAVDGNELVRLDLCQDRAEALRVAGLDN